MKEGQEVKNGKVYGCHCDLEGGEEPTGCVIDIDHPTSCEFAVFESGRYRRSKWTCRFWKAFKSDLEDGK